MHVIGVLTVLQTQKQMDWVRFSRIYNSRISDHVMRSIAGLVPPRLGEAGVVGDGGEAGARGLAGPAWFLCISQRFGGPGSLAQRASGPRVPWPIFDP